MVRVRGSASGLTMFGLLVTALLVCRDCPYQTIGAAVAAAAPGDRIEVQAGTYRETVDVDKPLVLVGSGAVLDGEGMRPMMHIRADNVRVEGFRFVRSGRDILADTAALRVSRAKHCVVAKNQFWDNFFAIYLEDAEQCRIEENIVEGVPRGEGGSGNGIHAWNSAHVAFVGNQVRGHRDGIYLEFTRASVIEANDASENIRYGLHFMYSDDNRFTHNRFWRNGAGVAVMYSHRVEMERNWFAEQQGPATYGLLLKEISDSTVACNRFEQNSVGVHMDQSNRNGIRGNDFAHNGLALSLWGSAERNRFEANTFRGNLFDVYTNTTSSGNNSFANNYFAAYTGYDRDRDGKGDLPFRPVSYSAVLLARYPLAGLLVKSLFFELLDTAERLIPAFAPVELGDPSPSLRPIDCAN